MLKNKSIRNKGNFTLIICLKLLLLSVFANADFLRNDSKQIVIDNATHLQWQDDTDIKTTSTKSWNEAINYCENLSLGEYTDWRLPNINELKSIIDRNKVKPAMVSGFQNLSSAHYWSSTTRQDSKSEAWYVTFDYGNVYSSDKEIYFNVLCVRNK